MTPIRAVYEKGVFRPLSPVELPEGARVEVSLIGPKETQPTQATKTAQTAEVSEDATEPLVGEELAALLQRIDALPLEGEIDSDLSTTYREILYPKRGEMP